MQSAPDAFAAVAALPGVPPAVAAARARLDRLAAHPVLRSRPAVVRAESGLRAARASAALAGVSVELTDLRSGAALDSVHGSLLRGALRVTAGLGESAATWRRAPRQALARLHALAAADELPDAALGRPATAAAAARLDLLADAVAANTSAPAIVSAALVHGELLDASAFGAATGLVARAASRLELVARGLDPAGVVAIEIGHAGLGLTEYQRALEAYGCQGADGVAVWVRHCAAAIGRAAADALEICQQMAADSRARH